MWRLLSAHERGDELEDVILDELRVDLRERAAARRARGRARLRQLGEAGEEREPLALGAALALLVRAPHPVVGVEHRAELLAQALAHASCASSGASSAASGACAT